ncbi:BamA/TamA family outer membrane protein [Mucilaginibacter sp. 14171R-50]|uniref:BamA/TamA family outer membrane protein n=1 Tax=Mucilaginibacter sp. 14171R-50 TaxID=2703789 RepID=UPI00138CDB92|nr:BamA/TamA family outer membrane protein [Mucilaginibacter sp. 14171R-50]QHS56641.1 BamA/TamA family outer membrane protein [Mucilaginibacter sp. 14171R-50]
MLKKLLIIIIIFPVAVLSSNAQVAAPKAVFRDSMVVSVHSKYDKVSGIHRWFFGKNYRKEWATPVKLPVIRISEIYGGLTPEKAGGGMQSKSLRLKDKSGKEWVLRSVEKTPDKLLPPALRQTFAVDWLDDALSGQHPFSALVVPPLAAAAGVPHANPVIGIVADDPTLGEYRKTFANLVCLLEEREPIGESDNSIKMLENLVKDNDNIFDGEAFLRARMLDLLLGDWDRHEDQWRWAETKKGKGSAYVGVPRDRDQVFHLEQGLFPDIAALPYINPALGDFTEEPNYKYGVFKTRFINPYPNAQMSHANWMRIANEFVAAETDAVLEEGLRRLPGDTYKMGHDVLLAKLKARRAAIPATMDKYYRFIYRIADIRLSDKNEKVVITGMPDKSLWIQVNKINKDGEVKDTIMSVVYNSEYTKEIRLYTSAGDDHITVNNSTSPIDLRLIGSGGDKVYTVTRSINKIRLYDTKTAKFEGMTDRLSKHLSSDTSNTHFVRTNPYNIWMPLATAALNSDDGFLLGLGFKYTKNDGFRKLPYTSSQQLMLTHAFATDAFRINYKGEWIEAIGKADFTLQVNAQAPDNTVNFFGVGNNTTLNKQQPNYRRFYRTRFDTYQVDPALRWHTDTNSTISVGPSFQYYRMDISDNADRLISNSSLIGSYDSLTANKDKAHLGFAVNFNSNNRIGGVLPTGGYYINIDLQGYKGLNNYSESFIQLRPEFSFYQKLTDNGAVVLSDRIGGGISLGKPAFYQSMFLGGQGNLLGYLQYRFAGKHMIYNNLQGRVKLFNIASYIIPGQLGLSGFYDTGRVWADEDKSDKWHHGIGGGLYFSPAGLTILQVLAGHSDEGWYPYISLNFRI